MSLLDPQGDDNVHHLAQPTPPEMLQFARFREGFAQACEGTLYSIDELEQGVATRRLWIFAGKDSAVLVEWNDDAAQLMWATGDMAELVSLLPGIEAVARMRGCTRLVVEGPRGWERVLRSQGFGFYSVTLAKGL